MMLTHLCALSIIITSSHFVFGFLAYILLVSSRLLFPVQVQEAPCDAFPNRTIFAGPILHISCNPKVGHLSTPATLKLPVTLREDTIKLPRYSPYDVRIFCRRSEDEEPEWAEMIEDLRRPVDVENGIVTFEVYHLSE